MRPAALWLTGPLHGAQRSLGQAAGPGPAHKHRWCPPWRASPSPDLAFFREPFAGRPWTSRGHCHQLLWAQRCPCRTKVRGRGREQAALALGETCGEAGLSPALPCLQVPPAPAPCPGISASFLTPSTASSRPQAPHPHCHSSLLSAQFPPPLLPRCQSPIQRVSEFKAFLFDKKKVTEEQKK